MSLWSDFLDSDKNMTVKWTHYFPIYERHFSSWQNKSLTFLEIGVFQGASLPLWQRYFGPMAKIIGIDINPECKKYEAPGIFIRIGDQSDPAFLQSVMDEFGVPDIVLDDGSHIMKHMVDSFLTLYPKMHKNAIYMIEDTHTCYWSEYGGGVDEPNSFINLSKKFIDCLHADFSRGAIAPNLITRETLGIHFYDSIVCFEKGDVWWKSVPRTELCALYSPSQKRKDA